MADFWVTNQTVVEIQEGGPGNPIKVLDPTATVSGPSGGMATVADRFSRDFTQGAGAYKRVGVAVDSDPERITFDLTTRLKVANFLDKLTKRKCEHNLRVRYHCGAVEDFTNYNGILAYYQTFGVGHNYSENIANGVTEVSPDVMEVVNESASNEVRIRAVQHDDISGSVSDFAINEVIDVGFPRCQGDCGLENDGNQEFWAVGDVDTTPGYAGAGAPNFFYTEDGGTTWTADSITTFLSGNALDVIRVGAYVLVAGATNGVGYAKFQDIKDLVANRWALATGFTSPNFPNALTYAGGGVVWACGNGGRIWKSTDGGFSFTLISNGAQTTQNLNDVVFASDTLGWFVGNSGAIVKYNNGVLSLVTVSGLTANLNTVATPDNRTREVYIGTAGGHIYRSRDVGKTWTNMAFPLSGTGQIKKLAFSGPGGFHLWVVQHNLAGNKSRVLRDLSGGALTFNAETIGSFDAPPNSLINSIAASDENTAVTVGELDGPTAFIGKIA